MAVRVYKGILVCSGLATLGVFAAYALFPQAVAGPDLIFSHRRHLARAGTNCADCHSVASSTSASDDNRPLEKTCLRCHDGVRAGNSCALCHRTPDSIPPRASQHRTYRFDHRLHLSLGNAAPALAAALDSGRYLIPAGDLRRHLNSENACLACHRGVTEVDQAMRANMPNMADCLVCHTRIDPPFSCGFCHTADAVLMPASHKPGFADVHSSPKSVPDKSTCKVCHGVKFTCMGCHT